MKSHKDFAFAQELNHLKLRGGLRQQLMLNNRKNIGPPLLEKYGAPNTKELNIHLVFSLLGGEERKKKSSTVGVDEISVMILCLSTSERRRILYEMVL